MKNNEIQANEVNTFKHKAACSMGAVIMPPNIRHEIMAAINAVSLPLRLVMRCRNTSEKWQIYANRVMAAITAILDKTNEGSRIAADIRKILKIQE